MARGVYTSANNFSKTSYPLAAPFSFAAWVNVTSTPEAFGTFFEYGAAGYVGFYLTSARKFNVYLAPGEFNASSGTVTFGAWTHIGITITGSAGAFTVNMFIGGTQDAGSGANVGNAISATGTMVIGMSGLNTPNFALNGKIGHPAFWSKELTATDFAALAARESPLAVQGSSLLDYWRFSNSSGNEPSMVSSRSLTQNGTVAEATGEPGAYLDYPTSYFWERDLVVPAVQSTRRGPLSVGRLGVGLFS